MKKGAMAATNNNLRVPNEIFDEAQRLAASQGRTTDEVAADALKRYIARQKLDALAQFGQQRAAEMGLDRLSEAEREEHVLRAIRELRRSSQS